MALNKNNHGIEAGGVQAEKADAKVDETISGIEQEVSAVSQPVMGISDQPNRNPGEAPSDIDSTISSMIRKVDDAFRREEVFILKHSNDSKSYLKGIKDAPIKKFQSPEVVIGLLSGVSGGKSSFLNVAICQYPISPVAGTTTSICAVETRRAESLSEERIEVCCLTDDKTGFQTEPICLFKKQVLNEVLFNKMFDYSMFLVDEKILNVKDTLSFFRDENGHIVLERTNWRNCMVLLMIVLDAYVYQDQQGNPNLKANYKSANKMRNELLQMLEVPLNSDYGVRLYWHSDRIPPHAVLVDLPGTGAAAVATDGQMGHTQLISNYLTRASSVICFFDEKATMGSETKELLDAFIQANELKGSSSTRLTFVLNKADTYDQMSDSIDEADEAIQTAINGFRQNFPGSAEYPVYALSSWDGEKALRESGISLRNLHHAAKFISDYKRFSRRDPSEEEISDFQSERFRRVYPCQKDANSDYERMDFTTFTNTLFSDYVSRIRFLLSLECFKEHMTSVKTVSDAISAEKAMYSIAHDYSPELAGIISCTIQDALDDELNDLVGEFQNLNKDMKDTLSKATGRIIAIVDQFDQDYSVLNGVINTKLQNKIALLERQNGMIPVDGNLIGVVFENSSFANNAGIRNQKRILALSDEIAKINFVGYFQKAFRHLNDEFETERRLYHKSIDRISGILLDFPNKVVQRMTGAFVTALEKKDLQNVYSFQSAFEIAKESTECLLITVCKNYADALRADTGVNDILLETANRIQSDLLDLLSPYTSGNYGAQVLNKISRARMFRANVIDETVLKALLTQYYIADFKEKMDRTLLEDISGKYRVKESHSFRMSEALTQLEKNHLSRQSMQQLRNQVGNACDVTDKIIGDPRRLAEWKDALDQAAADLQQFFNEGTVYSFFGETFREFADSNWAKGGLNIARDAADAAKMHADALLKTGSDFFRENKNGQEECD